MNYDGHIGYAVAPEFRRRGFATEILRQSLALLANRGIHRVLVTCDDDNAGSAAVIEANGGILEDLRFKPGDNGPTRRYGILNGASNRSKHVSRRFTHHCQH
ncbi:MAG: GNAT family N-acetyltransferase [Acidipropionibacterium jensenii]|nr:GNAT family N-acetyltransferase [Acidipropionibacterium jensenii]